MVQRIKTNSAPYGEFRGSRLWRVLDKAISELVKNGDIQEMTRRDYIVGYLAKMIEESRQHHKSSKSNKV
jgi:hypothetical protein